MAKTIKPAKNKVLLDALQGHNTLNLISYYPSGKAVSTPLQFLEKDGKIYTRTRSHSYKIKRIQQNFNVLAFACNQRGMALGPEVEAKARVLTQEMDAALIKKINEAFKEQMGRFFPLFEAIDRMRGHSRRIIEISL